MQKFWRSVVALCTGLMIAGCGGGGVDTLERVALDESNYLNAAKAMITVNTHLIGNMEVLGLMIGIINDGVCDSGTITNSGSTYTFDACTREGGLLDGTLEYSYEGGVLDLNHMDLTVSATDGSVELSYTDSQYRITFEEGSDDTMAKIEIFRSGYYKIGDELAIIYLGYSTNYDKSSATGTYENYNGSFILSIFSDKAVTVQTEEDVLFRTGDGCPSEGRITLIGEDSSLVMDIQDDFTIDMILDGEDKPSLTDCDDIGEYTL